MTSTGVGRGPATAKGAARREAIVAAAAAIVGSEGPDAVSHRTVAAAAGVPLAATTYYFASLDDLLGAAVERAADDELAAVTALVEDLPRRRRSAAWTAELVVSVVLGPQRRSDAAIQAHYERFLAGGRHPELRPVLRRARQRADVLIGDALERCGHGTADVDHLIALVDGTAISALVEGDGSARARSLAAVTAALERTAG
ncbi:MAG: Transcriptional regulator, AcrR family [uncultured Blastococcus sp.]|uniref:Transcriptional regulator, AcrR family n=1 Tax=uncultured Blastococcus sp. TaxID=217144 RepID=A0A6J4J4F8_9ACTN|nr:MAG: Transcriptional regulator, AcrR family [uncultured Blastococcus sp.]